ncbi:MAG: YfhO family protein, partial [bacterium]|nr:YfhO family protein [bacterium]
ISALFAGHIQVLGYVLSFVLIYSIYRAKLLHKIRRFWFIAWFIVLSVGIGAVQLLPGIELIGLSARSILEYNFLVDKILVQPYQLLMLFIPDIYGNPATANYALSDTYVGKALSIGFVAMLFVLVSTSQFKKSSQVKFFAILALVVGIMITANPISKVVYRLPIPFISSSSPTLMGFILAFSLSMLAGIGLDHWEMKKYKYVIPVMLIAGFTWVLYFFDMLPINKSSIILAGLLLVASLPLLYISTLKRKIAYLGLYALIFLQFSERWYSFKKFNSFVPKEVVYPDTAVVDFLKANAGIDRVWGYGSAAIDANFATQLQLYSPEGYDPLYPQRYGEFIALTKQGKLQQKFDRFNRTDAVIATAYGLEDLKENEYRLKVLDVLGVKYILDRVDNPSYASEFPSERLEQVYDTDGWKLFVNKKSVPRVQLVFDYLVYSNDKEFEQLFFSEAFDPQETVLLEEKPSLTTNCSSQKSGIKLISYLPNEVVSQVNTDCPGLLVLSDNYYPGWKVYSDEVETKIYRANYTFRAVVVPSGNHEIVFKYEPDSYKYGVIISLASVLIMGVTIIMIKRREK